MQSLAEKREKGKRGPRKAKGFTKFEPQTGRST